MKPLKFDSWLPGLPEIFRLPSHLAVSGVNLFHESFQLIRTSQLSKEFPEPENAYWFSLYTKGKRHFGRELIPALQRLCDLSALFANTYLQLRKIPDRLQLDNKPLVAELKTEEEVVEFYTQNVQSVINSEMRLSVEQKKIVKESLLFPEFLFLLKVVIPCLFLYSSNYSVVFRKARQGDVPSLIQLLRIDKTLIQHPRINKWVKYYALQEDKRNSESITNAFVKHPIRVVSKRKIKYIIAGFLAYSFEKAGQPVSYPEIQQLFDVVAADSSSNLLRDEELPEIENTFYTAVKREKRRWHQLLDKNRTKLSEEVSE